MTDPIDILGKVPAEVMKDAYSDAVSSSLKEASKVGVDFVKTVRLTLFPWQFAEANCASGGSVNFNRRFTGYPSASRR
jgi:hypothetical protein